jgi:hypothetical protein
MTKRIADISQPKAAIVAGFGLLLVIIIDMVVTWALYVLLKPVNKSLSLLAAWS